MLNQIYDRRRLMIIILCASFKIIDYVTIQELIFGYTGEIPQLK